MKGEVYSIFILQSKWRILHYERARLKEYVKCGIQQKLQDLYHVNRC